MDDEERANCIMLDDPRHPCYDSIQNNTIRKRPRPREHLTNSTPEPIDHNSIQVQPPLNNGEANNGEPTWSPQEIFFNDHSKLRDMPEGIHEISEVGMIAGVNVTLREASRRYMHYCLLNRPLRIGMVRTNSRVADRALAELPIVPLLVHEVNSVGSTLWDDAAYEGRVEDDDLLSFWNIPSVKIFGYDARLPRGGAPTIHLNNSMEDMEDHTDVMNHLTSLEGNKLVWFSSHCKDDFQDQCNEAFSGLFGVNTQRVSIFPKPMSLGLSECLVTIFTCKPGMERVVGRSSWPVARTTSRSPNVASGDETLTMDFRDTLKIAGNTMSIWNTVAGNNKKPTIILVVTFPANFDARQNIIACKPFAYRMPLLNVAVHECTLCGAFRQVQFKHGNPTRLADEVANHCCSQGGHECLEIL